MSEAEEAKILPILLSHSPGAGLPNPIYVASPSFPNPTKAVGRWRASQSTACSPPAHAQTSLHDGPCLTSQRSGSARRIYAGTMRFSRMLSFLCLIGGLILLGVMVRQVGPQGLLRSFQALGPWMAPYVLLKVIPLLLHTTGWIACFPGRRLHLRLWQLMLIGRAGSAINDVTPTATIGGEVVKVLLLESALPREQAIAAVVVDKTSLTLAKMLYLALGMLYLTQHLPLVAELQLSLSLTIGLVSLGLIGFGVFQRYGLLSKLGRGLGGLALCPLSGAAFFCLHLSDCQNVYPAALPTRGWRSWIGRSQHDSHSGLGAGSGVLLRAGAPRNARGSSFCGAFGAGDSRHLRAGVWAYRTG